MRKEDFMWQSWIDLAVSVWLIISTFVMAIRTPASMFVAGIVAIIFGFWAASNSWQGAVNGILGVWLFLSGVAFSLAVPWNFFISGIVVGILAIWNLSTKHEQVATHAHAH
jgi:hypothetical protein